MNAATTTTAPQVLITRFLNAPRELVFKAFSDPERLAKWYAPNDCTIEIYSFDFREGGAFHTVIRNPNYPDCFCKGQYLEVAEPERIVYNLYLVDADGNRITPICAGKEADMPDETIVTLTFDEQDGQTKLTLHQTMDEAVAKRSGAYPSWLQMLDKLELNLLKA